MKTLEYMNKLGLSDLCASFSDYDSGYISDVVAEIADSAISVYTSDQICFAADNPDWADEVILGGFVPNPSDCSGYREFCAAVGAAAWYMANESELYENIDDCLRLAVCAELAKMGYLELDTQQEAVLSKMQADDFETIEDAIDWVVLEFDDLEEARAA